MGGRIGANVLVLRRGEILQKICIFLPTWGGFLHIGREKTPTLCLLSKAKKATRAYRDRIFSAESCKSATPHHFISRAGESPTPVQANRKGTPYHLPQIVSRAKYG